MEYILCFLFFGLIVGFFFYKLFDGEISLHSSSSQEELDKKKEKKIEIERYLESVKTSLKSLDLENSIGKVDKEDFYILQKEYIAKWKSYEKDSQE